MTKVSVFGNKTEKERGTPIEFVEGLNREGGTKIDMEGYNPKEFDNVVLYSKAKQENHFDIILAYDDNVDGKYSVFLGHWNDGFVE